MTPSNNSFKYYLTIFTPTFNRGPFLTRIFENLSVQEELSFEWLIVDDGSTDGTKDIVESLCSTSSFEINYFWQENSGKHIAMNKGISEASGEYFFCLDSDDLLTSDALKQIKRLIQLSSKMDVGGFVGVAQYLSGEIIGKPPASNLISDTIEIRDKYKIRGEPEVYRSLILKNYQFPKFGNEKFLTEAYLFDVISVKYKLVYTNKILMIKDFQEDGLTSKEPMLRISNPIGTISYYRQRVLMTGPLLPLFKALTNYYRFSFHSRINDDLDLNRIFILMSKLAGRIMYYNDMVKLRRKSKNANH